MRWPTLKWIGLRNQYSIRAQINLNFGYDALMTLGNTVGELTSVSKGVRPKRRSSKSIRFTMEWKLTKLFLFSL